MLVKEEKGRFFGSQKKHVLYSQIAQHALVPKSPVETFPEGLQRSQTLSG